MTQGIALAMSGGGFRATLFHIGTLWRLNELGVLRRLKVITSVSGGSITAGYLGKQWSTLKFNDQNQAENFDAIVKKLREFCSMNRDFWAGVAGLLPGVAGGDVVARSYRKELFGEATLRDLPDEADAPRFIIYATSLQTGASVRFSKTFLRDYRLGRIDNPTVPLAKVVAASSAFPPVLSPVTIDRAIGAWNTEEGNLPEPMLSELRKKLVLTDGGVYDNMGLEAIYDRYETVLVSDAGAPFEFDASPSGTWLALTKRALDITCEQTRALRRRSLLKDFNSQVRKGTYWGIATKIDDYKLADVMTKDSATTRELAHMRTRLNAFDEGEQCRLINWGYALADAALRTYVAETKGAPRGNWPYPKYLP